MMGDLFDAYGIADGAEDAEELAETEEVVRAPSYKAVSSYATENNFRRLNELLRDDKAFAAVAASAIDKAVAEAKSLNETKTHGLFDDEEYNRGLEEDKIHYKYKEAILTHGLGWKPKGD
jgi:hypothetical protein